VDANGNELTDQHGNFEVKVPNRIIKLSYTYLVAWYVMHYSSLMIAVYTSEDFVPFLQKLQRSTWQHTYIFYIKKAIQSDLNYQLVRYLPDIQDTPYGDRFLDIAGPDRYTTLSTGCWLMCIRPGYLVFRQGDTCTIEPYLPSRFARQFGYDQLYVGNLNTGLHFSGNLFKGAQAWYFHMVGGTEVRFNLPQKVLNFYASLGFVHGT